MARPSLHPIGRPDVAPLSISSRFRSQIVYFAAPPDAAGLPPMAEGEIFFREGEVERWLDDGVLLLVSPLDTDNMTEVELEEEQETVLNWVKSNNAWHVRISEG